MSTDTKPAERGSPWGPADVERGLTALAMLGSSYKASEATGIPDQTLRVWRRDTHATRYQQIRDEMLPRIQAKIAADTEDLAIRYAELEHQALDALDLTKLKQPELAGTLRNLATSRAISIDKSLVLHGQPTVITEHRTATEVLDSLKRRFPQGIVDAEVVEDDELPLSPTQPARSIATDSVQTRST